MVIPCVALNLNLHPLFIVTLDTLTSQSTEQSLQSEAEVRGLKGRYLVIPLFHISNSVSSCSDLAQAWDES